MSILPFTSLDFRLVSQWIERNLTFLSAKQRKRVFIMIVTNAPTNNWRQVAWRIANSMRNERIAYGVNRGLAGYYGWVQRHGLPPPPWWRSSSRYYP